MNLTIFGNFISKQGQLVQRGYGALKSDVSDLRSAVEAGVTFFDGAYSYKDGPKLREALLGRNVEHFVLSSKIPGSKLDVNNLKESTEACFNEILSGSGLNKLDVLYLHGPDCIQEEVLNVLVDLKERGQVDHIGLSNVDVRTLRILVKAGYPISVVQNEFNPNFWEEDLLQFCQENHIIFVGYRPFGDSQSGKIFENETIKNIALRVNSTAQAVILQWMNQNGVTPIPHSNTVGHIVNNNTIPAWTLTAQEMAEMNRIKEGKASTCNWQKFLNKDLLARSSAWINQLENHQ